MEINELTNQITFCLYVNLLTSTCKGRKAIVRRRGNTGILVQNNITKKSRMNLQQLTCG